MDTLTTKELEMCHTAARLRYEACVDNREDKEATKWLDLCTKLNVIRFKKIRGPR